MQSLQTFPCGTRGSPAERDVGNSETTFKKIVALFYLGLFKGGKMAWIGSGWGGIRPTGKIPYDRLTGAPDKRTAHNEGLDNVEIARTETDEMRADSLSVALHAHDFGLRVEVDAPLA